MIVECINSTISRLTPKNPLELKKRVSRYTIYTLLAGGESQIPVSLSERELQIIELVATG